MKNLIKIILLFLLRKVDKKYSVISENNPFQIKEVNKDALKITNVLGISEKRSAELREMGTILFSKNMQDSIVNQERSVCMTQN